MGLSFSASIALKNTIGIMVSSGPVSWIFSLGGKVLFEESVLLTLSLEALVVIISEDCVLVSWVVVAEEKPR